MAYRALSCLMLCAALLGACLPAAAESVQVYFQLDDSLHAVSRELAPGADTMQAAVEALVSGPTAEEQAAGVTSAIAPGTTLLSLSSDEKSVSIDFSAAAAGPQLSESLIRAIYSQATLTLTAIGINKEIRIAAAGVPLSAYLPPIPTPAYAAPISAGTQVKAPLGAIGLSGKRVTINPGHGWEWEGTLWATQRGGVCSNPCEDFHNLDITRWLKKYLEGDGAYVQVTREFDKTRGNGPSGHPWWQEATYVWLKDAGYECSVYASSTNDCTGQKSGVDHIVDDIRCRGLASNMDARGNTDIFLTIHTNSADGTAKGTTVWYTDTGEHVAYGPASIDLCNKVGDGIIAAIAAAGEKCADGTDWGFLGGVGTRYGDYGESRIPARPAALLELGFHDNCTADAPKLVDPFFQSVAMWGEYKGVCDYFGVTPTWGMYSNELVSHDIPTTMSPGEARTVHITFRNRGILWQSAKGFKLSGVDGTDAFTGAVNYAVATDTGPGDTYTFSFTLTAPTTPGYYLTDWQMQRTGYQSFGAVCRKSINVGLPADTQAPTVPTGLSGAAQTINRINLAWNASTDNVWVAGYKVYRGGVQIATTLSPGYSDTTCEPDVTYSYRVSAFDDANNESAQCSAINVTTPFPSEIILDEGEASYTGTWTAATGTPPACYGGSYKYAVATTSETATAIFRPTIVRASSYDVYVYYRSGTNRTQLAPYTVYYNGGSQLYRVNQEVGGGEWHYLGRWPFAAGTAGYVKLGNNASDTGEVVIADAVRFLYVSSVPPDAPTDAAPTAVSSSSIAWNWNDVSLETGYRVKDTGGVIRSRDLAADTITWVETGLAANTQYARRVYAFNANGESAGSSGQTAYAMAVAPTYAASGNVTVQCSAGQTKTDCTASQTITFTFNNAFGTGPANVGQFDYSWDQNPTWDGSGGTLWASGSTLTKQAGSVGQSYYLHLRSYNSDAPKVANPTTLDLGPYTVPQPAMLVNGGFELGNTGGVGNGWTSYLQSSGLLTIQIANPAEGLQYQQVQITTANSYGGVRQTVTGCVPGTVYTLAGYYRTNSTSATVSIRVDPAGGTTRPATIMASTTSTSFTPFSGNVTATGTSMTIFLDTAVTNVNKAGAFDGLTLTGASCTVPATPGDGTPAASSATSVTWNWSDVSTETGYRIKDGGGTIKSPDLAANTTQWAENGLTPNTQYTRKVYAFNACGESVGSVGQTRYTLARAGESTDGTAATGNVYCTTATKNTWYQSSKTFTFSNPAGFGTAGTWKASSFQYKWNKASTEAWSTAGTAWTSGTISLTAASGDGDYYLHVRAINGDGTANNADVVNYGPFRVDGTAPGTVSVTDEGSYTPSQNTLKASWSASTDSGSGLDRYEYAVGTSASSQNTRGWTSNGSATASTVTGLSLIDGSTYYVQARAVDAAGNASAGSAANGILVAPAVAKISDAWSKPNTSYPLCLRSKIVTYSSASEFYLEESNASSAIRVVSAANPGKGNLASVAGVLGLYGPQRVLHGDVVIATTDNQTPRIVAITGRYLGGASYNSATPGVANGTGLYNVGLVVRICGKVDFCDNTTDVNNKYCYINDGSGLVSAGHKGVKVECGTVNAPTGGYATMTGVVASETVGGLATPVILIRSVTDINSF